jgi:hypothetical protein
MTTASPLRYSQGLKRGLFAHVYFIEQQNANGKIEKEISKIIFLQNNENDNNNFITWKQIDRVKKSYENEKTKNLVVINEGKEITVGRPLSTENYPLVTIMKSPSIEGDWYKKHHVKSHETAVKYYIKLIVFNEKFSSNIENFLNYCDRKKASKLERCELETALLTLIELIRERFLKFPQYEFRITYYDLRILESADCTWEYNDFKLILVDTLVEYVRTRHLLNIVINNTIDVNNTIGVDEKLKKTFTLFMPVFLSCLQETLDSLLTIHIKEDSTYTIKFICKTVCIYPLSLVLASFLCVKWLCLACWDVCCCCRQCRRKEHQCKRYSHLDFFLIFVAFIIF